MKSQFILFLTQYIPSLTFGLFEVSIPIWDKQNLKRNAPHKYHLCVRKFLIMYELH